MSSPFRLTPPQRRPGRWLHRPRLVSVLTGRFQRRLTVVRGGAGFGKTTLLLQALDANEDGALGVDCWLGLSPRDARPSELASALRAAVQARGAGDAADAVCEAIWRRSPREIALILDDVHHVEPGGPGAELLARLVNELPANGHLVLAGRRAPPVPMARLLASGDALEVDEEQLAFTPAEESSFLALRGVTVPSEPGAGWPALAELTASVGAGRVESYLWEEILHGLSPARRTALARLASLDWIDKGRIAAFAGAEAEFDDFVAALPLTSVEPNGAARLHALWEPVLTSIDPAWTPAEFRRALDHLAAHGHYREAVELCLRNGREDAILPLLEKLVQDDWQAMAPESLETLIATLPRSIVATPLGELLKGLLALHVDPLRAQPFVESAQRGLRAIGDTRWELVTLSILANIAFFQVDRARLHAIARAGDELGTDAGRSGAIFVRATIALVECRPREALALVDEARRLGAARKLGASDAAIAVMAFLDAGEPDRAIAEAQAAIPGASVYALPALWGGYFDGLWFSGQVGPGELAAMDGGLPPTASGHAHNQAVALSILGFQNACLGRTAVARRHLDAAAPLIARGLGERAEMAWASGRMALAACEGDEDGARQAIEGAFACQDAETLAHRHALRASALASVLSPAVRARVAGWGERGTHWALALATADALIAFRERGETEHAAALPWETPRRFSIALVPPLMLELAVAAASRGNAAACAIAERLSVDHRGVLRRLGCSSVAAVAGQAQTLLRTVPERPAARLELRVLGRFELVRDGVVVDDPVLRRERVRVLLQFLAAHGEARRDDLCAAFWPELTRAAAANNLRVTLTHLRNLLEPDRDAGAPSFFLRQAGDVVVLRLGDGLALDADRFESLLAEAETVDRMGDPAGALARYEDAAALHRGDFLSDAPDPAWGDARRRQLRARLVTALLRIAELRLGRSELDRAVAALSRALEIDPLNEAVVRADAIARERRDGHAAARHALERSLAVLAPVRSADPETRRLAARFGLCAEASAPSPVAADSLGLSTRELEVLRLVDRGFSNGEIARQLFVAPSTVKTHLENVYGKLGVRRRTQALAIVRERRLL